MTFKRKHFVLYSVVVGLIYTHIAVFLLGCAAYGPVRLFAIITYTIGGISWLSFATVFALPDRLFTKEAQ